jgi:hypothetical protein
MNNQSEGREWAEFERREWADLKKTITNSSDVKSPEMTVDLPYGQKLTFANLKPNTIVEIATWIGTGPPNDSSVRMLIGASLQPTDEHVEMVEQKTKVIPAANEYSPNSEESGLAVKPASNPKPFFSGFTKLAQMVLIRWRNHLYSNPKPFSPGFNKLSPLVLIRWKHHQ